MAPASRARLRLPSLAQLGWRSAVACGDGRLGVVAQQRGDGRQRARLAQRLGVRRALRDHADGAGVLLALQAGLRTARRAARRNQSGQRAAGRHRRDVLRRRTAQAEAARRGEDVVGGGGRRIGVVVVEVKREEVEAIVGVATTRQQRDRARLADLRRQRGTNRWLARQARRAASLAPRLLARRRLLAAAFTTTASLR